MQPTHGAFYNPSINAKPTSMRCVAFCKMRLNPAVPKFFAMVLRVVCAVCIDGLRVFSRMPWLAGNRWRAVNKWKKLRHIVSISPGQNRIERESVRICQNVMFTSRFASIRWIFACFSPPPTARTVPLSIAARDQSI